MPFKKNLEEHCPFCNAEKIGNRHYRLDGVERRQCTNCGKWKDPVEFTSSPTAPPNKITPWCKECRSGATSAKTKLRRQTDPEYLQRERAHSRAYVAKRKDNPDFRKKRSEAVLKSRAKKSQHYAQYSQEYNEKQRQLKLMGKDKDKTLTENSGDEA
jgi:hypothetical protein